MENPKTTPTFDHGAQTYSRLLSLPSELRLRVWDQVFALYPPRVCFSPGIHDSGYGRNMPYGGVGSELISPTSQESSVANMRNILNLSLLWKLKKVWLTGYNSEFGFLLSCRQIFYECQPYLIHHLIVFMTHGVLNRHNNLMPKFASPPSSPQRMLFPTNFHTIFTHLQNLVILYASKSDGGAVMKPSGTTEMSQWLRDHFPCVRKCTMRRVYDVNVDELYTEKFGRVTRGEYERRSDFGKIQLWRGAKFISPVVVLTGGRARPETSRGWSVYGGRMSNAATRERELRRAREQDNESPESDNLVQQSRQGVESQGDVEVVFEGELRVQYGQSWSPEHVETFVYTFSNPADLDSLDLAEQEIASTARIVSEQERIDRQHAMPPRPERTPWRNRGLFP